MAKNNNLTDFVRDLADGFREKTGTASEWKINPQDFSEWVTSIPSTRSFRKFLDSLQMPNMKIYPGSSFSYEPPSQLTVDIPQELVISGGIPLYPVLRLDFTLVGDLPAGDTVSIRDMSSYTVGSMRNNGDTVSLFVILIPNMRDESHTIGFSVSEIRHDDEAGTATEAATVNISAEWVTMGLAPSGNYSVLSLRTGKGVIVQ